VLVDNPLSGEREEWSDALFSARWKLPRDRDRRLVLEQLDPHVLEAARREHLPRVSDGADSSSGGSRRRSATSASMLSTPSAIAASSSRLSIRSEMSTATSGRDLLPRLDALAPAARVLGHRRSVPPNA
jgi:hypothetical protein